MQKNFGDRLRLFGDRKRLSQRKMMQPKRISSDSDHIEIKIPFNFFLIILCSLTQKGNR